MLAPRRRWPSASRAHASSPRAVCALRQTVHTVHPDTTAPNQQSAKAAAELQTKLYNAIFWLALITLLHVRHAPPSPWPRATRRMLAPTRRARTPPTLSLMSHTPTRCRQTLADLAFADPNDTWKDMLTDFYLEALPVPFVLALGYFGTKHRDSLQLFLYMLAGT